MQKEMTHKEENDPPSLSGLLNVGSLKDCYIMTIEQPRFMSFPYVGHISQLNTRITKERKSGASRLTD